MPRMVCSRRVVNGPSIFGAQPLDRDLDDVGVAVEIHVPDQLGDRRLGEDLALAPGQHGEQRELLGGEVDAGAAARHLARDQVDLQVGDAQLGGLLAAAAPRQRVQPRHQLQERERLDQIVVGAVLQAADPVLDAVACGQHDHRCLLDAAQCPDDGETVDAGQHGIEDDDVVVVGERQVLAVDAVVGDVDGAALLGQALVQVLRRLRLVLDDEQLHGGAIMRSRHHGRHRQRTSPGPGEPGTTGDAGGASSRAALAA